jgi:hypothetical protein
LIAQGLAYMRDEEILGEEVRHVLIGRAQNMDGDHSYFDYAHRGEPLEEIYGRGR